MKKNTILILFFTLFLSLGVNTVNAQDPIELEEAIGIGESTNPCNPDSSYYSVCDCYGDCDSGDPCDFSSIAYDECDCNPYSCDDGDDDECDWYDDCWECEGYNFSGCQEEGVNGSSEEENPIDCNGVVNGSATINSCGDCVSPGVTSSCEEEFRRCDDGFTKNINKECVPCSGNDCNDCDDNNFKDICGKCTTKTKTEPSIVEGRCNGIRTMLTIQSETGKEIAAFFTESNKMIILTNNGTQQNQNETRAQTLDRYNDTSGNRIYSFSYREKVEADIEEGIEARAEGWFAIYRVNGNLVEERITGHYHTHPYGHTISDLDQNFASTGQFTGISHYYAVKDNQSITEYNGSGIATHVDNGVTKNNVEYINCKKNPETINCN